MALGDNKIIIVRLVFIFVYLVYLDRINMGVGGWRGVHSYTVRNSILVLPTSTWAGSYRILVCTYLNKKLVKSTQGVHED